MIKEIYSVLDRCCYKSSKMSGVYLYIPGCRRRTPGWSRDSYNTRRKTAGRCRDHQDTCRGGSGLQSPGQGHHSSLSNTCGNYLMSKSLKFQPIMLNIKKNVTNLSQLWPVVWSLQVRHCPVWESHCSAWPLQVQGRQLGKPQCPGRQRSHCRPYAPGIHSH